MNMRGFTLEPGGGIVYPLVALGVPISDHLGHSVLCIISARLALSTYNEGGNECRHTYHHAAVQFYDLVVERTIGREQAFSLRTVNKETGHPNVLHEADQSVEISWRSTSGTRRLELPV